MPVSSLNSRTRVVALVAAPALVLGGLAAMPAPSYAAPDPNPTTNGAVWLSGELTDGALVGEFGPDYGLSIDAGLALVAVQAQPRSVADIAARLATDIDDYVTGEAFGDTGSRYAGAVAKSATFATEVGADPTDFGGRDLIADVEASASDAAGTRGRVEDTSDFGDFANTIGQAFAVRALQAADSPEAGAVTDFLLGQQCSDGFFRLSFSPAASPLQDCDSDPSAAGSTDVTAFALMALLDVTGESGDADVQTSIDAAVGWLLRTQGEDGTWGGAAPTTAPNANSTGLAGWALNEVGTPRASAAAARAAVAVRMLQADDFAPCLTGLTGATGAIAYDQDALDQGRDSGIGDLRDQYRRTTAQALPVLLAAPSGATGDRSSTTFVRPGASQDLLVEDVAPGQTVCFDEGNGRTLRSADAQGTAGFTLELPDRTARRSFSVSLTDGSIGTVTVASLARARFATEVRTKRIPENKKQRVTVRGLAKGESLTIRYQGRAIERAVATGRRYSTRFDVTRTKGKQRVQVIGEFGNRRGIEKFRVVKAR